MNLLLLTTGLLLAQASAPEKTATTGAVVTIRQVDDKKFPDISLEFEVKEANGSPILEATQSEFQVFEDGRPVTVTKFQSPISREFRPTTVVLVLDRSGSMLKEDRIGGLKKAVSAFLENQPKGSRVAVIAFGSQVELICPFTDDPDKVGRSVNRLFPDGQTRYYDAVSAALELLSGETGRRAILAMTDGDDNFSQSARLDSVIRAAQREGLPVHTLCLGSDGETEAANLRVLAEKTRGRAFTATQTDDLRGIFEEIARNLGQTYGLSYTTDRPIQDGTLRPIEVLYSKSAKAARSTVYVQGIVVPAAGWSWLFLAMIAGLGGLACLPSLSRS
jgi:Ca-activated chloride channel family protein